MSDQTEYARCDICGGPLDPDLQLTNDRDPTPVVETEGNLRSGVSIIVDAPSRAGRVAFTNGCDGGKA